MTKKRKRKGPERIVESANKRCKLFVSKPIDDGLVKHSVLSQYYCKVLTLREYLLSRLPASSKIRRKRIASIKCVRQLDNVIDGELDNTSLARYLNLTLVGVLEETSTVKEQRWRQWTSFSQLADNSESTINSTRGSDASSMSELVDFGIWQLFKQNSRSGTGLQHLLCQGFRKDVNFHAIIRDECPTSAIPGVISVYPNLHATALKGSPWPQVLALMGKFGQNIMIDLILDCGIFTPIESGHGNYYQLSGKPLGDLQVLPREAATVNLIRPVILHDSLPAVSKAQSQILDTLRLPASITFVRNRMLYARPALNAKGRIRYGLRHIHVLNRYPYRPFSYPLQSNPITHQHTDMENESPNDKNRADTIHVMMYIFPREFGLHNVFTSSVNPHETVQPFKDYTLREEEIARFHTSKSNRDSKVNPRTPKRLRRQAINLVEKLQILHSRCPYNEILDHYCSNSVLERKQSVMATQKSLSDESTCFNTQASIRALNCTAAANTDVTIMKLQPRKTSFMDLATPAANVSAFCRSTIAHIIPNEFWGTGENQAHNRRQFMEVVDRFIHLRRFESLSLHNAVQGMKIRHIPWLAPHNYTKANMSQSDAHKRIDLFYEFLYYLIDSILIPLIRSHFYVTESSTHRYRLFFFRHDIWRSLSEPALASLKLTTFEEMNTEEAQKRLHSRTIGFSQLRLLPKQTGVRPITNLKRRTMKKGYKNVLGSSINSVLAPVYNIFTYEMNTNPGLLGSTICSVGDLYNKLKQFSLRVKDSGRPLFFAKVDVQSAFDTIPQSAVLRLMSNVPQESEYKISKHVEIKPGEDHRLDMDEQKKSKPIRKWISLATSPGDFQPFDQNLESNLAVGKKNTVFVENVVNQFREKDEMLGLLGEHIQQNMIKIGKKFYRQKNGIPQGSVLSSLLCNYFYADLELNYLEFLRSGESLLLRLVDDFLLVTTNRLHAKMFVQIMHDGLPDYGVTVNPAKTLVNFEVSINDLKVTRLVGSCNFPYCGNFIDTKTLDIRKDRERTKDLLISDSLTVEFSRSPGKAFHRKVLNAFKIQAHAMFLDTSFNSLRTVFSNIYDSFVETATKMWQYRKCLPLQSRPGPKLVIRTIADLVQLAFILLKSKGKNKKNEGYQCAVTRTQLEWLAMTAFHGVLTRKQSQYREVILWLDERIGNLRAKQGEGCIKLVQATAFG